MYSQLLATLIFFFALINDTWQVPNGIQCNSSMKAQQVFQELKALNYEFTNYDVSQKKQIGSGSYGTVYSAVIANCVVAIKCGIRVIKEARLLSIFDHENIIKPYGTFDDCMIMEYYKDIDLIPFIVSKNQNIDDRLVAKIMKQIALGVKHIEEKGYIHTDLKPDNVLIDIENEKIVLCDFDSMIKLGSSKKIITVSYAAPEVCTDLPLYGYGAHSFSIGQILSCFFCAEDTMYDSNKWAHLFEMLKHGPQPHWSLIPSPFDMLVKDCTQLIDAKRITTEEIISRLEFIELNGQDEERPPIPATSVDIKRSARHLHHLYLNQLNKHALERFLQTVKDKRIWLRKVIDLADIEIGTALGYTVSKISDDETHEYGFFKGTLAGHAVLVYVVHPHEDIDEIINQISNGEGASVIPLLQQRIAESYEALSKSIKVLENIEMFEKQIERLSTFPEELIGLSYYSYPFEDQYKAFVIASCYTYNADMN